MLLTGLVASLHLIDRKLLYGPDNYIYVSEAHGTVSWIHQAFCTTNVWNLVIEAIIGYDKVTSDHRPLGM